MRLCIIFFFIQSTAAFVVRPQSTRLSTEAYGIFGRFRKQRKVEQVPPIEPGATLPEVDVELLKSDSSSEVVSINEYLGQFSKAVLVGTCAWILYGMICARSNLPFFAT
jgi:hypothetical protein